MSNLKVIRNGTELKFKSFNFPGGEVGLKLDLETNKVAYIAKTGVFKPAPIQTIVARIKNSNDIIELAMLTDALRRLDSTPIRLLIPYCAYSRQDRVCDLGESFSLKVFANLINSLKFDAVCTVDPHSNVCEAVFDNLRVVTQFQIINQWTDLIKRTLKCKIICPDGGALKKTFELARFFEKDYVSCEKIRNLSDGKIIKTVIYHEDFHGQDAIIFDDLCEKGGTFIALAQELKKKNAGKIVLFVTHGLFSGDINVLYENGISDIWTTDSYREDLIENERFHILRLEDKIEL